MDKQQRQQSIETRPPKNMVYGWNITYKNYTEVFFVHIQKKIKQKQKKTKIWVTHRTVDEKKKKIFLIQKKKKWKRNLNHYSSHRLFIYLCVLADLFNDLIRRIRHTDYFWYCDPGTANINTRTIQAINRNRFFWEKKTTISSWPHISSSSSSIIKTNFSIVNRLSSSSSSSSTYLAVFMSVWLFSFTRLPT